ncbi:hypothetical protein TD95_002101 [Thielaviopsis punctulata]|uniref:USP domain-containing protein n=1 Tax=Thielaviopsis punctulata TaxID=72032 RepID=A0A0F4ZAP0_9PEZI|nr:hypothetical protein TD95_002101 [Thielaviopsis punctulata]
MSKASNIQAMAKQQARVNPPTKGTPMYGCEHTQMLLTQPQENINTCINNYKLILRRIFDDVSPTVPQTARNSSGQVVTTITSNYLCLQCPDIVTEDGISQHGDKKAHRFYVDSRSGVLYCHMCDDLVYDPTLEELRLLKQGTGTFSRRKRRVDDMSVDDAREEMRFISTNTTAVSCRANGLRGLYNAGATCYQNVVLQSFLHNPILRNYYLSDRHAGCNVSHCLSCAMDDVFQEFYGVENTNGYTPANILSGFWISEKKAFENLVTTREQDAHEFFQFLAEELHERNSELEGKKEEGGDGNCACIVHQIFHGKTQTTTTCLKCNQSTDKLQSFLDLNLGLESSSVRKKRGDRKAVTLQDCLDAEYVSDDKCEYRCQNCKTSQNARRQTSIKRLPNTLTIQLKRFEFKSQGRNDRAIKIDTSVEFPLELNMLPYTTLARHNDARANRQYNRACTYDLVSVIVHSGDLETGHYLVYCRVGDQWFKFNDHKVEMASLSEVLSSQAYLLFYIVKHMT